jgi:hypothetical protein
MNCARNTRRSPKKSACNPGGAAGAQAKAWQVQGMSMKLRSLSLRLGCFSLRSALASI